MHAVLPALLFRAGVLVRGWNGILRDAGCAPSLVFIRQAAPRSAPVITIRRPLFVDRPQRAHTSRLSVWLQTRVGLPGCWNRVLVHALLFGGCVILTSYLYWSPTLIRLIAAAVVCCACLFITVPGVRLISVLRQHVWILHRSVARPWPKHSAS
ncbi:hypothetical protein EON66_07775 [archaeon]|nr:MAG: hypothetical protein EON66_07775 [archaeon]